MKYKLKIPDMIPKKYAQSVAGIHQRFGEIDIYTVECLDDLAELKARDEETIIRIGTEKTAHFAIPKDWLVEVKESPFQKWNKEYLKNFPDTHCIGNKSAWNAAIDAVINYWWENKPLNTKLDNFIAQDILQFKEP